MSYLRIKPETLHPTDDEQAPGSMSTCASLWEACEKYKHARDRLEHAIKEREAAASREKTVEFEFDMAKRALTKAIDSAHAKTHEGDVLPEPEPTPLPKKKGRPRIEAAPFVAPPIGETVMFEGRTFPDAIPEPIPEDPCPATHDTCEDFACDEHPIPRIGTSEYPQGDPPGIEQHEEPEVLF